MQTKLKNNWGLKLDHFLNISWCDHIEAHDSNIQIKTLLKRFAIVARINSKCQVVVLTVEHSGGDFWAGNFILGRVGSVTPIWDVLAPQGEQEQALNHLRTRPRSLSFLIRQGVPVGLVGLGYSQ